MTNCSSKLSSFILDFRLDIVRYNDNFALFKLFDEFLINVIKKFVILELNYLLEMV